jgi:beta-glucosidase-like glycosyl hydrolase
VSHSPAALLIPELRWDPDLGFSHLQAAIADALELGVGGFHITNGPASDVRALSAELQRASRHPLLLAASAERGAGGTITGLTGLPPFAALGALRDDDAIRRAARLTARELRRGGVNWALAPCLDLAHGVRNPFLGARSFGADPQRVAEWGVTWIDACQAEGVMATALTLPGTGRASADPTLGPVTLDVAGATLWNSDLVPFRAAVDAGVATVLVSQVSYPRLDASGAVAARSSVILEEMMRGELQYEGLLVSDSAGVVEPDAAVRSIGAGCDLVLAPHDVSGVADALHDALSRGALHPDRVDAALARRTFWAEWGLGDASREATLDDVLWARKVADTVVYALRGVFANVGPVVDVIPVDDDAARAWRGEGDRFGPFLATLRAMGHEPRLVRSPTDEGRGAVVLAMRGEPSTGRGRAGYSEDTRAQVARVLAEARAARRSVVAVLFGPPAMAEEIPDVSNVICAWGGDRAMQEAAARRLA